MTREVSGADIIQEYLRRNYRIVFWKDEGSDKGPRDAGWTTRTYTGAEYEEGKHRVGLMLGVEVEPGKFLHDVDIDWAAGARIASKILQHTPLIYGRKSKPVSHCFYTTSAPIPTYRYNDIDGSTLIEIRGVKKDGSIGFQSMAPPSVWQAKEGDGFREPLRFLTFGIPLHMEEQALRKDVCMAAMAMLLAKHLGVFGFGHDVRLCWAGFFLRIGFTVDELIRMGEAISLYCQNTEVADVRTVLESTQKNLANPKLKLKGGPSLAKYLGDQGRKVLARIYEWLGKDSDFVRNKDGAIVRDNQENIKAALEILDYKLTYNEFTDKMLVNGVTLEDRQLNHIWLQIDAEFHFRPSFEFYEKVIKQLAYEAPFHPVRQYLDSLKWDGVPRINTWLIELAGVKDTPLTREMQRLFLIAAVRRVRHPGCKFDEMIVLESAQGMQKSSALRVLCPVEDWFSDDLPLNVDAKQIIERTLGKWIIEASDLAGKRKADVEQLKAMLSRQVDGPARMAYARLPIERPRQFVIAGTTNWEHYLIDATGGRRFWPLKVEKMVDLARLREIRDQLWAEAAHYESEGASIRLSEHFWDEAAQEQAAREEIDGWEEIIAECIEGCEVTSTGHKRIATSVLWDVLGIEISRRDRTGAKRISEIMHKYGFRRTKVKVENRTTVGYESRQRYTLNLEGVDAIADLPASDDTTH